jgi:serine/threonine-protein kinase
MLEPVVAGMHAAHARGVIHRDLKPGNVFLADDGSGTRTTLVLDFGLAKILSDDGTDAGADKLTRTGALLGTPWYMAPEQLFGESSVDYRADVWAIGAIVYECIAGRRPIEGKSYGQIAQNVARRTIAPLAQIVPTVNGDLAALTGRMLDKDRAGRPALGEVHALFQRLLEG